MPELSKELTVHNHFYRRLQRHAQISILMRAGRAAPAPQEDEGFVSPEGPATKPLPLVQATLAPAAGPPAPPESGNPISLPVKATEAGAGPAAVTTSDAVVPAPSVDEAASDDPGWQRLQAIKRKHEARPKTEDSAPEPPSRRAAHNVQRKPAASPHSTRGVQQGRQEGAVESPSAAEEAKPNVAPKALVAPEQDEKTQRAPAPSPVSRLEAVRAPQSDGVERQEESAASDAAEDNIADPSVPHKLERGDHRESASGQLAATAGNLAQRAPTDSGGADTVASESATTHATELSGAAADEVPATGDSGGSAAQQSRPTVRAATDTLQDTDDSAAPGGEDDSARPMVGGPAQARRPPQQDAAEGGAPRDESPVQDGLQMPSSEAQSPGKSQAETLPLQAAWPVQRKESGATNEEQSAPGSTPAEASPTSAAQDPLPDEDAASLEKVRRALETMSSGPTASGVELVLPRRPRPSTQRKPAPRREIGKKGSQGKDPAVVQTDIGPLPADLWQLLDAEPAQALAAAEPAQAEVSLVTRQARPQATVQRAPETVPSSPSPPLPQSAATMATQPAVDEMEPEGDDEAANEEAGEVDIEALARQVLTRLRRRLAVEWERGRGRI